MEMTTRRLRPRSRLRIGWWKRSSSTAPWPTTGSRRLRDCSSRPPTDADWATRLRRSPPTLSLRRTGLLVNGRRDVQIASEIAREIPSADRIDLLCAFVRHSGLRLFRSELEARARAGARVRVIASVYTGSTERRALDALIALGARVKVSYEIARTRLHAKAWLFHRDSGLHTAYIGSSNLTHAAQVDGLEWNVRVSAAENPEVIERFAATFEQYWQEPEFEDYEPGRDTERLDRALSRQSHGGSPDDGLDISLLVDVAPKPHQDVALEALKAERQTGHCRNLIVAATGTGKTWIAAFDFKQLRKEGKGDSLLFVAHRDEILRQSQQVFQLVLREPGFGERLIGGERPRSGRHVFASVQSLANRTDDIEPDGFDVVIVDEFHHAAAASYDRLLKRLRPKSLLGLTATPERADGKSVLEWFDGRIAFESRLWDALDQGLLCPFHYFGVDDTADLSTVRFERGRYVAGDLDNVLTGDHVRALRVRHAVEEYVTDPHRMRALGFCAGVAHATSWPASSTASGTRPWHSTAVRHGMNGERRLRDCDEGSFEPSSPSISSTKASTCRRSTPCSCSGRRRAPPCFSSSSGGDCGGQKESGC